MVTKAWTVCFSIRERKSSRRRVFQVNFEAFGPKPNIYLENFTFSFVQKNKLIAVFRAEAQRFKRTSFIAVFRAEAQGFTYQLYYRPEGQSYLSIWKRTHCSYIHSLSWISETGLTTCCYLYISFYEQNSDGVIGIYLSFWNVTVNRYVWRTMLSSCYAAGRALIVTFEEQCLALVTPLAELLSPSNWKKDIRSFILKHLNLKKKSSWFN